VNLTLCKQYYATFFRKRRNNKSGWREGCRVGRC
jgi:hypothetical protein